jgi:hypothetical protein
LQASAGQFAALNTGFETDYYVALVQAKQLLDQQAIAMDPTGTTPVCKLMVWFTDGRLELDNRTNQEEVQDYGSTAPWAPNIPLTSSQPGINGPATNRARQLMCQPGGLVDQMRSDGIFSAVFPLETQIAPSDLDFLGAVAQGQDGSTTCGTPGPAAESSGALIPSSDASQIVLNFYQAAVLTPPIPPGSVSRGVCPSSAPTCTAGSSTFVLDPSLSKFNILGVTQNSNIDVDLTGPTGVSLALGRGSSGSGTLSGAQLSWNWLSPTTLVVTGTLAEGLASQWSGTWSVTFLDPNGQNPTAVNDVEVFLFSDLTARVTPGTQLRKGAKGQIPIQIVDSAGTPQTNPAILKDVQVTATIAIAGQNTAPLALAPTASSTYTANYMPAINLQASTVDVDAELSISTPDGYILPSVGNVSTVPLENPIGFPSIGVGATGEVFLSPIRAVGQTARGTFDLKAGLGATGCAWLTQAKVSAAPPAAGPVVYHISPGADEHQCVQFRPGAHRLISVTAAVGGSGTGEVDGTLHLVMRNSVSGTERQEAIPVRFSMDVPVTLDKETAIWLVLAGVLGPLLLLYLINLLGRRFESFDQVRYLETPVRVSGSRDSIVVARQSAVDAKDASIFSRPQSLREFECAGFTFRAYMSPSPFGAVTGRIASRGEAVVTSRGLWRDGREGFVPLGLGALWALRIVPETLGSTLDADAGLGASTLASLLIILNSEDSPQDQLERLESSAIGSLPDLLRSLVGRLPGPTAPALDAQNNEPTAISDLPPLPGDDDLDADPGSLPNDVGDVSVTDSPGPSPLPASSDVDEAALPQQRPVPPMTDPNSPIEVEPPQQSQPGQSDEGGRYLPPLPPLPDA